MKFWITGVNHKSAPVEVRERLAFDDTALIASPGGAQGAAWLL